MLFAMSFWALFALFIGIAMLFRLYPTECPCYDWGCTEKDENFCPKDDPCFNQHNGGCEAFEVGFNWVSGCTIVLFVITLAITVSPLLGAICVCSGWCLEYLSHCVIGTKAYPVETP